MIFLQLIGILFWLLAVPFCTGLIPLGLIQREKRNAGLVLLSGYFILFSVFWLVAVPAVIFVTYNSFLVVVWCFTILSLVLAVLGIVGSMRLIKKGRWVSLRPAFDQKTIPGVQKLGWGIFFFLLLFQLYQAFTLASFDGDDAYYVAQSLITQQSNTMYLILPYTGGTTSIDLRHALAVFPMWIAYIGKVTNIHSTIIAHSVLPLVLIPMTYLIYFEIGKRLLAKHKNMLAPFMILVSLFQIFGNVSIYTSETFLLTRTWQGKSLTANVVIPALIWLLLWIFGDKEKEDEKKTDIGLWILLAMVNMTAGICSSMAVFLGGMLVAVIAFWVAVGEKKLTILVKAGVACIPNAAYMLLYLLLR